MLHLTHIKVRGYHLDLYGHVNNARYLEFLEEGRWGWLEASGGLDQLTSGEWGFSIVNVNVNFRRAAELGDVLEVRTALKRVGGRSAVVHQDIVLRGTETPVADADVTFVILSQRDGKAAELGGEAGNVFSDLLTMD